MPVWIVRSAVVCYLPGSQAEQKEILLASLLGHLDCRPVPRPNSQSAIHHELHVARPAGFIAGRGDLLRHVAGWNQSFGQRHTVIRNEHDPQTFAESWISVDS